MATWALIPLTHRIYPDPKSNVAGSAWIWMGWTSRDASMGGAVRAVRGVPPTRCGRAGTVWRASARCIFHTPSLEYVPAGVTGVAVGGAFKCSVLSYGILYYGRIVTAATPPAPAAGAIVLAPALVRSRTWRQLPAISRTGCSTATTR